MHASVLRYLREVARCGSVRKAAQALHVASSAVNRQILQLEDELGLALFDRLPSGMRPTPAGELLLRHVRDTLYDFERLRSEMDELRGVKTGHIRIAAIDSLLVDFLPRMVDRFARDYPAVTLSVLAVSPGGVFDDVASGQADIGLTFVAPRPHGLQVAAAVPMPIGAVMSAGHPLAARPSLPFDAFQGYPLLLQDHPLPAPPFLDDDFTAFRASIQPRLASNSIEFLRRAIHANLGVAFFTRLGFLREIEAGEMVFVPFAAARLNRLEVGLFIPSQRSLPPVTAALVNLLAKQLVQLAR